MLYHIVFFFSITLQKKLNIKNVDMAAPCSHTLVAYGETAKILDKVTHGEAEQKIYIFKT